MLMIGKYFLIGSAALLLITGTSRANGAAAQNRTYRWNLDSCINYAVNNNIDVRKSMVVLKSGIEDIAGAKAAFLPSLSAGSSQNFTYLPSSDVNDHTSYSGNYTITASYNIYQGGKRSYNLQNYNLVSKSNELSVLDNRIQIKQSVIEAYIQVLYNMEAVKINKNTEEVSRKQMERGEALLEVGSISKVDYAQLVSRYKTDYSNRIASENNLSNAVLTLKQLLEMDITDNIEVEQMQVSDVEIMALIPSKKEIYYNALDIMPQIKSSEIDREIAALNVKSAKSGFRPTLSVSTGVGTSHNSNGSGSFSNKLWNNFSQNAGLSLSIPIYSNRQNRTAVNKANLAVETADLQLANAKKQLLQQIESIYLDAVSAQTRYPAAVEAETAAEETYNLTKEQFEIGMKNTLELLTAQNDLLTARQEVLQSKYTVVRNRLLLETFIDISL